MAIFILVEDMIVNEGVCDCSGILHGHVLWRLFACHRLKHRLVYQHIYVAWQESLEDAPGIRLVDIIYAFAALIFRWLYRQKLYGSWLLRHRIDEPCINQVDYVDLPFQEAFRPNLGNGCSII